MRACEDSSFLEFARKGEKLTATAKAVMTFKHRLKRLKGRGRGISMQDRYRRILLYVTGWMSCCAIDTRYNDIMGLDHLLRRRINM